MGQESAEPHIDVIAQISSVSSSIMDSSAPLESEPPNHVVLGQCKSLKLGHHIFSSGEWKRAKFFDHPTMNLSLSVDMHGYKCASIKPPEVNPVSLLAKLDSCAQSCLWSLREFLLAGFSEDDLIPVTLGLSAANHSRIPISGAIFARLEGFTPDGSPISCRTMVYVSSAAQGFYLSLEAMVDLGLVNRNSPLYPKELTSRSGCDAQTADAETCSCPRRGVVPDRPSSLPFEAIPENIPRMKEWLLDTFKGSTFNTCPHQPLPALDGPPIHIHVSENCKPRVCHTPAMIPLHWQAQVYSDLKRDEALGVIEKVPYGDPVTWCHRMVVTRKGDGSPRRTVDLSPLNKFCKRETFATESPFHIARRIPKGTWKTVTDAWNGFHGVPLDEASKHLTTFITPYGRYRYIRAPQGFLSSCDGYNQRYDAILSDFGNKERCVDDVCHHDTELEEHWWRTIDLLRQQGNAGIVLNSDKFQFCERQVDFAGFRVSDTDIEPLPKYLDAIRDFPSPKNISDVRSWFGLVNQVSNYAQLRDLMAPFKPFLSPRCPFTWNDDLEDRFIRSKTAIIEAIKHGVTIDTAKYTCLRPDWSSKGLGYYLSQKHCSCKSELPGCCSDGWKVTLVGSRFLHGAEQRYAAVEGEALAVAWSLEQTRYFTQGCDDLIIVTDHKPLVKLLGDRTLDEIFNTRLFRIKQRTLPWRYSIFHMPGKSNSTADTVSRHPSDGGQEKSKLLSDEDHEEIAFMASLTSGVAKFMCISWEDILEAYDHDPVLKALQSVILDGFPSDVDGMSDYLKPYWNFHESLLFFLTA